jgi:hypothetical protein
MKVKMPVKLGDEQAICPFTIEPSGDCTVKKSTFKRTCPFTLEPCFQRNPHYTKIIKFEDFEVITRKLNYLKGNFWFLKKRGKMIETIKSCKNILQVVTFEIYVLSL